MTEADEVARAQRLMRRYNRRHLLAQLGLFTIAMALCSGWSGTPLLLIAAVVLAMGAGVAWVGAGLARDWRAYAQAQDVLWRAHHPDDAYD